MKYIIIILYIVFSLKMFNIDTKLIRVCKEINQFAIPYLFTLTMLLLEFIFTIDFSHISIVNVFVNKSTVVFTDVNALL